jgi:hypothetical protein
MTYSTRIPMTPPAVARGIHYTSGADFLYFLRTDGIYRVPVNPAVMIAEVYGYPLPSNKQVNLNSIGTFDLKWTGTQLVAQPVPLPPTPQVAKIAPLSGVTSLDQITLDQLLNVSWGSATHTVPEQGTSTGGNFYAVRIPAPTSGEFNYAKVRVYANAGTKIDWVTYIASPNAIRVSAVSGDLRDIVVSQYEEEIYVSGVDSSNVGYVARSARTTGGPYPEYSSTGLTTLATLVQPQQIVLDGSVIYVVDQTSLWRIDPSNGDQDEIVTGLNGGVGLLLDTSGAGTKAYIADTAGNVRVVNLDEYTDGSPIQAPAPTAALAIGGASGFLRWADEDHTAFFAADRSARQVKRIDVLTGNVAGEEENTNNAPPWGVAVISPSQRYVSCDTEIGHIDRSIAVTGVLLLGIGLIPFDYINNSTVPQNPPPSWPEPNDGKADTSLAQPQGYYFWQYPNLPFGGTLSLMLNHALASSSGIGYYKISLQNITKGTPARPIAVGYTDMLWNSKIASPRFEPKLVELSNGRYPIRPPTELWYNTHLAAKILTSTGDNGHNILKVDFFTNATDSIPVSSFSRLLLIDNTHYGAALVFPRIGTPLPSVPPALDCGCITYVTKNDLVAVDFTAWHPQGAGDYTLSFSRGNVNLGTLKQTGPVVKSDTQPPLQPKSDVTPGTSFKAGHLLGDCDLANIQISISTGSRVIDGFGWVALGASSTRSFTLVKGPVTHTPWP